MPKIIQTMLDVLPDEALLVRSTYLRNDIKASALVVEARRRVRDLVTRADDAAEHMYLEAKSDGYAAGILQAADELTRYLAGHAELAAQLRLRLQQEMEAILKQCVTDPSVVMAAFDECLNEQDINVASELHVLLPESMRASHRGLVERLSKHIDGHITLEYHEDARFVLRIGDHVAEFSPDDFVTRTGLRVMSTLPSIYAESRDLADKCRTALASVFSPPIADENGLDADHPMQREHI